VYDAAIRLSAPQSFIGDYHKSDMRIKRF